MEEIVNFGETLYILPEIIIKKYDVIKEKRLTHFCINLHFLSWQGFSVLIQRFQIYAAHIISPAN